MTRWMAPRGGAHGTVAVVVGLVASLATAGAALAIDCGEGLPAGTTVLTGDLNCPASGLFAGTGTTSSLDLDGHTLAGSHGAATRGIGLNSGAKLTIKNGTIRDFDTGISELYNESGSATLILDNVTIVGNTNQGVDVPNCMACKIKNSNIIDNDGSGVILDGAVKPKIDASVFAFNGGDGLRIDGATGLKVAKSAFTLNGGIGLAVVGGTGATITKNAISSNVGTGLEIGDDEVGTTVAKNQIGRNGLSDGIRVVSGEGTTLLANLVFGADDVNISLLAASNAKVKKNVLGGGDGDGILVGAAATNVLLDGNLTRGHSGEGIQSSSASVTFKKNHAEGNGVGFDSTAGNTDAGGNTARGNVTDCVGPVGC